MTNGLPDDFSERWGAMEANVGHMKEKLDKVEPSDIINLKQDMALIKRIGAIIVAGVTTSIVVTWRKLTNGG